jgi:hypothetical protein
MFFLLGSAKKKIFSRANLFSVCVVLAYRFYCSFYNTLTEQKNPMATI